MRADQTKKILACHCQRLTPIGCMNQVTQEDLLCDDCREGCNAAFGASDWVAGGDQTTRMYIGFHMRTEIRFG